MMGKVKEMKTAMLAVLIGLGLMLQVCVANAGPRESIVVAGGCFWCVESDFEGVPGVISAVSGFSGGKSKNPTYKSHAGHYEAVKITFDAGKVSREKLLHMFMRSIDPTDAGGQFCDRGSAYKTAVFYSGAGEKAVAKQAVAQAGADLGRKIATKVLPLNGFYPAEAYHQDYYKKNPNRYKFYRWKCGRDQRVKAVWKNITE